MILKSSEFYVFAFIVCGKLQNILVLESSEFGFTKFVNLV